MGTKNKKIKNNLIKINFKKFSKKTDLQAIKNARVNPKDFDGGLYFEAMKEFLASQKRFERAMVIKNYKAYDYAVNVRYWKKHGKLPERVDLAKEDREANNNRITRRQRRK